MDFPLKLATNKPFDAVGFGLNAVDHLIVVPAYPAFDTKIRLLEHKQSAGGQTATAMVSLQRLGFKTAYAGRFGSDEEGHFGLATLKDDGVNVDYAEVVDGARNQIAFITIDVRNGERTIVWDRDDRLAYRADEAPVEFGSMGRVLHLDAHDPPACLRLAQAARKAGAIISADIDNVYDGLLDLLPLIDILIGSKEFPHRVTGISGQRASVIELKARYGCAIVGMTMGTAGAIVYCNGEFIESPAFEAPGGCKDTTGAGDAFVGSFAVFLAESGDDRESIARANLYAAISTTAVGTQKSFVGRQRFDDEWALRVTQAW